MATYLGAAVDLGPDDVDTDLVARGKVLYLEGYLWDQPPAKNAFLKAARAAKQAGRKVALSLSDSFCVDRHRESFLDLVENHVDLLFANETEITSLYEVDTFDAALQKVRGHCEVAALTRSAKGSVVLSGEEVHVVDAVTLGDVLDSTGAGDLYAAGFLFGYTHGYGLYDCGRLGALSAAEVISHMGPRPERSLAELVSDYLE
jgi:sugar/nucleoside kinase (ribokinase family)